MTRSKGEGRTNCILLLPRHLTWGPRVIERDVGQIFDERDVQLSEAGQLRPDNIPHLFWILSREVWVHARVAHVRQPGDAFVEVALGEALGQHEERNTQGGDQIHLVREADAWIVAEDFDGFVEAAGKVEGAPFRQVGGEGVEVHDAVFDHDAIEGDVGVEVDASTEVILEVRDRGAAVRQVAQKGIVVGVLGKVEAVPVLRVADAEDEVDDFGPAFLPFFYGTRRVGVGREIFCHAAAAGLGGGFRLAEYPAAVGKGVADWGAELPQDLAQGLLEVLVDADVLVVAEEAVGELREGGDVVVRLILPPGREGEAGGSILLLLWRRLFLRWLLLLLGMRWLMLLLLLLIAAGGGGGDGPTVEEGGAAVPCGLAKEEGVGAEKGVEGGRGLDSISSYSSLNECSCHPQARLTVSRGNDISGSHMHAQPKSIRSPRLHGEKMQQAQKSDAKVRYR